MTQPIGWQARVSSVVMGGLLGAIALGICVAPFMGFAALLVGKGGWSIPLGTAIAVYASWPISRLLVSSPTQHDLLRLVLLGFAQWMCLGFLIGAIFCRLLVGLVQLGQRRAHGAARK